MHTSHTFRCFLQVSWTNGEFFCFDVKGVSVWTIERIPSASVHGRGALPHLELAKVESPSNLSDDFPLQYGHILDTGGEETAVIIDELYIGHMTTVTSIHMTRRLWHIAGILVEVDFAKIIC